MTYRAVILILGFFILFDLLSYSLKLLYKSTLLSIFKNSGSVSKGVWLAKFFDGYCW